MAEHMNTTDDAVDAPALGTTDDATPPAAGTADSAVSPAELNKKIASLLLGQVEAAKREVTSNLPQWKANVDRRMGTRGAAIYTGGVAIDDLGLDGQSTINPDWALTKTKTANLYSQVPTVQLTHEQEVYAPAVFPFAKAINYELGDKRANVGVPMEEVLNDVVNAAGIGGAEVTYIARYDSVKMAEEDSIQTPNGPLSTKNLTEDQLQRLAKAGLVHLVDTPRVVSDKFAIQRISPADILTPKAFTGSCFDNADWVGRKGRKPWPDALVDFKLNPTDKATLLGTDVNSSNSLRLDDSGTSTPQTEVVEYEELYYWRHRMDPDEKSLQAIWRLVYVKGKTEPAIHEPWKGQQFDPTTPGKFVGCSKFPIRILTLTYITDNPIPPSDSQAGRPQVDDMRRSRSQMFQNRQRSIPIRWFDVNRIDPTLQDTLMRGVVQGMIPTNGDGSRAIGEIARASYPAEDLSFDQQTKRDLMDTWQIGENQSGGQAGGKHTAAEADIVQQNFATRIGQERGRVAAFFLSLVEVLAGLMVLNSDFPNLSDAERSAMTAAWDDKHILHDLVFTIRPDSTVLLDTNQQIDRIAKLLNLTVKSGYINPKPLIAKIIELSGEDPTQILIDPQPPKQDAPNLSFRFTGKDDLMNPLVVGMLIQAGYMPSPQMIEQSKQLLLDAQQPAQPPQPPAPGPALGPGGPGPSAPLPPGAGGAPGVGSHPQGGHDAHPAWQLASKVAQRSEDM